MNGHEHEFLAAEGKFQSAKPPRLADTVFNHATNRARTRGSAGAVVFECLPTESNETHCGQRTCQSPQVPPKTNPAEINGDQPEDWQKHVNLYEKATCVTRSVISGKKADNRAKLRELVRRCCCLCGNERWFRISNVFPGSRQRRQRRIRTDGCGVLRHFGTTPIRKAGHMSPV